MTWLTNSPDLNPIEHFRQNYKKKSVSWFHPLKKISQLLFRMD